MMNPEWMRWLPAAFVAGVLAGAFVVRVQWVCWYERYQDRRIRLRLARHEQRRVQRLTPEILHVSESDVSS